VRDTQEFYCQGQWEQKRENNRGKTVKMMFRKEIREKIWKKVRI
jgi:hypothetical protein